MPDGRNVATEAGEDRPAPGYDHDWLAWSPLPDRPAIRWPGGAPVAVTVVLDVRAVEWERPELEWPVRPPGGRGVAPYPDLPRMSHREFGHRVGVFRLLDVLRDARIAPAAAVDVLTVERYGPLLDHLLPAASELLAGGLSASRPITSRMSEEEERHYIGLTLDRLTAALGTRPAGWLGPEHGESARTPGLLASAGLDYVADWCDDEQPCPMTGAARGLWSFPLSWELCDLAAMFLRDVDPPTYERSIREAFDVLRADGAVSGRVLALHLHPWLSGQAFRAAAIEAALHHVIDSGDAWVASPLQIIDWCRGDG